MRNLLNAICRVWCCGFCGGENDDSFGSCPGCGYERGYQRVVPYEE